MSSSLLLFVQRFSRCALQLSSGISYRTLEPSFRTREPSFRTREPSFRTREPSIRTREPTCRNREPSQNFEPNSLFNPCGYPVRIPLTIAGVEALSCVHYYSMLLLPLARIEPAVQR